MTTLYRNAGYTLSHLIEDIRIGRIALPDIQRPFVWSATKTRDLFDSMYRGYPVGTLMFWETGADVGTRKIGIGELDKAPQLLIVDGQQRLTSLYAVLTGSKILTKRFEEKHVRIAFRPSDETFAVADAAIERDPEYIPDITELWRSGYRKTSRQFLARLTETRDGDTPEELADLLDDRINRVHDLNQFPFQVVELGVGADEEQVAEIFVRINSEGVQLNQADFILTLMSVHWEQGRRDLENFSRAAIDPAVSGTSPKNPFIEPSPDQMLRVAIALAFRRARLQHVYSILRGKDLETGAISPERRGEQFARLAEAQSKVLNLTNWHEFIKCIQSAGFRSRKMISSDSALLFSYAFWLLGRYEFGVSPKALRPLIARWFFMAQTTSRYTSSAPESQLESDLNRLSDVASGDGDGFAAELDRIVSTNFTNDYWDITLPNRLDTSAARSPALFAYLAALQLLDAEALFSDVRIRDLLDPAVTAPRSIERHHLFPKKHLAAEGITGTRQVNAIANMAHLDWSENAEISANAPLDYWPKMTDGIPAERLKRQQHLHALPIGWEQLEYPTFLERRRTLIARVVREGFESLWGGDAPTQEPTIRDLIRAGESQTLEFKSTARWSIVANLPDPKLEAVIVKTVCGFLNAEGGSLLIGVDDEGKVLGLELDLKTLGSKQNVDGYELMLRQLLETNISVPTAATVRIRFPEIDDAQICHVSVAASGKPVFAKPAKGSGAGSDASEFWVRTGNLTKQLHGDDLITYTEEHWG